VYYETLINDGTVDDSGNLIQVLACPADFNGDNMVDGMDLAFILASWGTANEAEDLNGDGTVDGMDLAGLLAAWGACP
jgi:hypothetical protein